MSIERKDVLMWVRAYCRDDFYGDAVAWEDDNAYEIGDIVIADDTHTYIAKTDHTSNDDPPPDNTTDWEYTEKTLPGGIRIALDKMAEFLDVDLAIQSEALGDYSKTYSLATNWANLPPHIRHILLPYRRVTFA